MGKGKMEKEKVYKSIFIEWGTNGYMAKWRKWHVATDSGEKGKKHVGISSLDMYVINAFVELRACAECKWVCVNLGYSLFFSV